jgi:hypothetical protein
MIERAFNRGDRVRHNQGCGEGIVVRYFKPSKWEHGMVFWKGWNPFQPERIDWTWDFAMTKLTNNLEVRG